MKAALGGLMQVDEEEEKEEGVIVGLYMYPLSIQLSPD